MFYKKKKLKTQKSDKKNIVKRFHFEKLSPVDTANIEVYEEAIDFAFENNDIRNVAISGAYGSGKSSLLATYKKKHPDKKFIHISLAHFKPEHKENNNGKLDEGIQKLNNTALNKLSCESGKEGKVTHQAETLRESVLEGKILNQLLHQLKENDIPQTNFRIKKTLSSLQIALQSVAIIALFVTVIHLTLSYTWINFVSSFASSCWFRNVLEITTTPASFFVSGCIGLGIIVCFVVTSVKRQRFKAAIRKLSFQGNDIELFEGENDSFFDKYLNEVLYLFENADVDAIVFEDMDRYDMEGIFERLHEVNTLANIRLSSKKIIRFFFLLRDDLFVSKDRTKFFDYIIPVVPVLDSSNSYDQLIEHIRKNKLDTVFDNRFLQGLSLYIDDMRLLKNICNEFLIYYNRLGATAPNPNKMLAIVTYKNIFPKDFSELQLNKGFVYAIFAQKEEIIEKEEIALQSKIDKLNKEISDLEREKLQELREVDAVFVDKVYKGKASSVLQYGDTQLTNWLKAQLSGDRLSEYENRRKLVEGKISYEHINKEIEKRTVQEKKDKLNQMKMVNLINRENINDIFDVVSKNALGEASTYEDVKRNQYFDLLKYLIRNGYIDETYADYMTYFYPNSLTTVDKIFLQSITNKIAKEYTYELKDPEMVLSKLSVYDFDEEEILNFSLLTYLLKSQSQGEYIRHLIVQLRIQENFDFISQYLAITPLKDKFVLTINKLWPSFWRRALEKQALPEQQILEYSQDTLFYSSEEEIKNVNDKDSLAKYISSRDDYLNVLLENHTALMNGLILLDVKFQAIDYTKSDHNLFMQVYEQSCYVLTYDNIALILMVAYGIADETDIRHRNYWAVTSKKDAPLCKYVQQEIGTYADIMLAFCDDNIQDYESAAIEFLNHIGISLEQKRQYISKLCTVITTLKDIEDSTLWSDLLDAGLVVFSEKNLMDYWLNVQKFDASLIEFINETDQRVNLSTLKQNCDEDTRRDLFGQIIVCKELANEKYIQMLTSLGFQYIKGFSIAGIPEDKLSLVIDAGIVRMSQDALKFIRANYPTVRYQFIRKNINDFVKIMTPQLAVYDEIVEILSWEIGDEIKLSLLEHSKAPISVVNKGYSTRVNLYILLNRLDPEDMQTLCVEYSQLENDIKNVVISYAETHIESIIDGKLNSSDTLKLKMLSSLNVSENNKYKLLSMMLKRVDRALGRTCFAHMKLFEFSAIFNSRAKPKILKNDQNKKILDILVDRAWIYDYTDYPHDINYYTVRRNAPSKKRELTKV